MIKVVILLLGMLCGAITSSAQELKKIKIGYPAIAYNQIHIWVAKDAGLFRKHGLDTEIVFFRGGQMATQALVAGDPPIVNIGTVVQAGLQGHDVVLIASSENAYHYSGRCPNRN
jgi:NitT/TauT family transport system substrate-binding protein